MERGGGGVNSFVRGEKLVGDKHQNNSERDWKKLSLYQ